MITRRATPKRRVRTQLLTTLRLHLDANGLETGVNNAYGQVDGSNNIVSWKGLASGSISDTFGVIGSGITYDPATKSIHGAGTGTLRSAGAASLYNFMSEVASGIGDLRWTAFILCKIADVFKPTATYGLMGNNGSSSASKGMAIFYANNTTNEDTLQSVVTKGSTTNYIGRLLVPGSGPSNQWCVICYRFDGSASTRYRQYLNDQALLYNEQLHNNNVPVATPTYPLEFFGVGNGVVPMVGNIKEVLITAGSETYETSIAIIRQLMNKNGIVRSRTDYLDVSLVPEIFDQSVGTTGLEYHLCGVISQNPVLPDVVFSAYSEGASHVYNANKKLVGRKSVAKAAPYSNSFGAQANIYDPAGAEAIQDCGGGFDNNGVMHLFCDVLNSGSAGGCIRAQHIYSSDQVTWTNVDITSSLHADGLLCWRMYGNMIHVGGVWIKPYYKVTDQGNITNSANYILRSTDGLAWTSVTVRASASAYINEASVFWLGGNNVGYLARNEVTQEWSLSLSADLGLTWDAFTDVTFGETVTSANPAMVKTFIHNGQLVVVAYITNRDNDTAFAIYGLPANIISSRGSGWNLNTKIMWWKTNLAPFHYHYGDVTHLDNTIKAVGLWTYDQWPGGGTGVVSRMNYTVMPTWHVAKIESELGI
jgi:hypothetical protein